jgi:hypothetical protein
MKRWKLKPRHRGKRGGVTVAVTGKQAGQPEKARVQEILYDNETIEGDHWEQWAGRGSWLMEVRNDPVEVQSSAPEPAVSRQESRLGIKPPPAPDLVLKDPPVPAEPMVQPTVAPTVAPDEPVSDTHASTPLDKGTPTAAPEEPEPVVDPGDVKWLDDPVRARDEDGHFKADDPETPEVNEAFDPPKPVGEPAKADADEMSREDLETMAYERKVKGPDGEDPSDAPNKSTLVAWINGESPPKPKPKRRRRKS